MSNRWVLTAVIAAVMATISASPAGAAETAPAEAAPPCFSLKEWDDWTWTGYRSYAEVTSSCTKEYRVRVIWKHDFDGKCRSVYPGTGFTESRQGRNPSVDEIRRC